VKPARWLALFLAAVILGLAFDLLRHARFFDLPGRP